MSALQSLQKQGNVAAEPTILFAAWKMMSGKGYSFETAEGRVRYSCELQACSLANSSYRKILPRIDGVRQLLQCQSRFALIVLGGADFFPVSAYRRQKIEICICELLILVLPKEMQVEIDLRTPEYCLRIEKTPTIASPWSETSFG